jgi:hypothetical protein
LIGRARTLSGYRRRVRFEQRLREGIADGSITVAFRRWRRPQVAAGRRYRTGLGLVEMSAVDLVGVAELTDADARDAGYADPAALLADLTGPAGVPLYRLRLRRVDEPDPRAVLAADDRLDEDAVAGLTRRLDRLDRAGRSGPWTRATLRAIAERPGVRAPDLAASFGRETLPFKVDVRKLKTLGLTESLPVGYRLSPRGRAYLARTGSGSAGWAPSL